MIDIKKRYPEHEHRTEISCETLRITMICHGKPNGPTVITAVLDDGLSTEREVTWDHACDHPIFRFQLTTS